MAEFDVAAMIKDRPNLAFKLSRETMKGAGQNTSRPGGLMSAMQSQAFKDKVKNLTTAPDIDFGQTEEGAIRSEAETKVGVLSDLLSTRGAIFQEEQAERTNLKNLARFNKESHTQKRLSELKPTQDIDNQIVGMNAKMIAEKARLRDQFKHLDPSQRDAIIKARMATLTTDLNQLEQVREARLGAAKRKIGDEIDSQQGQVDASNAHLEALESTMDFLTKTGATKAEIASIGADFTEKLKKLQRSRKGGLPTEKEMMLDRAIVAETIRKNRQPTGDEIKDLRRRLELNLARGRVAEDSAEEIDRLTREKAAQLEEARGQSFITPELMAGLRAAVENEVVGRRLPLRTPDPRKEALEIEAKEAAIGKTDAAAIKALRDTGMTLEEAKEELGL